MPCVKSPSRSSALRRNRLVVLRILEYHARSGPAAITGGLKSAGLAWVFTGTPDFFDARRGVKGLEPLHDRIKFEEHNGVATTKKSPPRSSASPPAS